MSNLETLTLANEQLPRVKVHPTAVIAILQSFMRRGCSQRVIGTLLGSYKEGAIEIVDCYEVPYEENVEEMRVALNLDYHKRMYDFHRRVNKREHIVGWFATTTPEGEYINETSYLFNDIYTKYCPKPIILVVDTLLSGSQFNIRAYQAKTLKLAGQDDSFANLYNELHVIQEMSEAESSAIYHMLQYQNGGKWSSGEIASNLPTEQDHVTQSLEKLLNVIDNILNYVDAVVRNEAPALPEVGMKISEILGSLQTISGDSMNAVYRDKVQESMMVSYLSTLTKAQAAISQKLNSIL